MRKPGLLQKLILTYVVFVVVLLGLTVLLFVVSSRVSTLSTKIYLVDYQKKDITDKLITTLISLEETTKQYMLLRNESYSAILQKQERDISRAWDLLSSPHMYYDKPDENMVGNGKGLWIAFSNRLHSQLDSPPQQPAEIEKLFARNGEEIDQIVGIARYVNGEAIDRLRTNIAFLKDLGDHIMVWTWWVLGIALSIGLIIPVLIYRSIIKDLNHIKSGIKHIANGDFAYRISLETGDELGLLADSFNNMAQRLKQLDDMKSEFVSVVSHELKTPLTSMKEAANLLLEGLTGPLIERQKRLVEIMDQGIKRLLHTVSELLEMSRIESGMVALQKEMLDMNAIVSSFISEFKPLTDTSGVDIRISYIAGESWVMADKNKILQVLTNLAHNAIKYSPEGSSVEIRIKNVDSSIVTEIEDHGKGIPEEDLTRIFEKFYQSKYTRGHGGIGLGLAISRGIIHAHGGRMYVQSSVGQGSIFSFSLPVAHNVSHPAGMCE
jgi:two-component system sensor histidine kinase GlrK